MKPNTIFSQSRSQSEAQRTTIRRFPICWVLATLLLTLLLAACQPIQPMPSQPEAMPATSEAIELVQAYYAALNGAVEEPAKIDEAMAYLAESAIFINPTGSYMNLEEIRKSLAEGAEAGLTFDLTNFRESGRRVVYDFAVKIGADLLDQGTDGLTIVKDGKIIFDGTERTEPSYAQYADPALVVQAYYAALNNAVSDPSRIDLAMQYIDPSAIFINPTGSYKTQEEIRASLVGGAKDGLTFDLSNFRNQDGRVVYDYQVKIGDELLDAGSDGLTIVKAGKIIFDGTERTELK